MSEAAKLHTGTGSSKQKIVQLLDAHDDHGIKKSSSSMELSNGRGKSPSIPVPMTSSTASTPDKGIVLSVEQALQESPLFYSMLVHVISHADLEITLRFPQFPELGEVVARPQYSFFKPVAEKLRRILQSNDYDSMDPITLPSNGIGQSFAIGVSLKNHLVDTIPFAHLRLRSRDLNKVVAWIEGKSGVSMDKFEDVSCAVTGLYFPLLCVLLPKWVNLSPSPSRSSRRKFIYLITGSATARNLDHDSLGNCTENLAHLAREVFIERFYSDVEVIHLHSGPGLFSFNSNVKFMNSVVQPAISKKRSELAHMFGDKYPSRFHLMISLLNGAVARNQALNASLRQFNPDFLHIPDSKFFWHGFPNVSQLWDNEVELLRFETSEINPPVDLAELDTDGRLLVLEMIKHKAKLEEAVLSSLPSTPRSGKRSNVAPDSTRVTPLEKQKKQHKQNELESFWLRKTKQPVLSVLMTQKEGEASPKFYCGINIEVSMPTGSLCAERSAIGNALATDPTLRRSDMKMIAVLSMTLNPAELISDSDEDEMKISLSPSLLKSYSVDSSPLVQTKPKRSALNPIAPCGACKEWLKKIAAVNPDFRVLMFTDWDCRKVIVKPII